MENFPPIPKSHKVFSIPELATLVVRFSTKQERARLVRTCRTLYNIAVPFVWETVCGAQRLLLLVDQAGTYCHNDEQTIFLKESFRAARNAFARFDFYASHVKYLDVYGPKGKILRVAGWKVLVARARQQVLLPNLHTFIIKTARGTNGLHQSMWVGTFSSPSLVNLLVTDGSLRNTPTVSYPAASFMMKSLVAHYPKIKKLELFPSHTTGNYPEDGESSLLAFLCGDPFYQYAAHLADLRHLTCNFAWLEEPALRVLGQLPHLENIDVYGAHDPLTESSVLPENSFPSLRRLHLHLAHPWDAVRTLNITQMVKGLTSLHVSLGVMDSIDIQHDEEPWFIDAFCPLLLNAPRLTDLWIDANPCGMDEDDPEIDEPVLRIFQTLPLKSLYLGRIVLTEEALRLNLALVWPSVTRLCIPKQPVSLSMLSLFALLPELHHLELELNLDQFELECNKTTSPLATLQASPASILCSNLQEANQIIRALVDVFPNLTHMNWPTNGRGVPSRYDNTYEHKYQHISFVNGHLAALLELFKLKQTQSA
ncbi:hypothetical protein FRC09_011445 [Ceratobasidium sp. 395]|nr:hypothetical protein FRC09_011445 [Ceratobasidium sp. 395]